MTNKNILNELQTLHTILPNDAFREQLGNHFGVSDTTRPVLFPFWKTELAVSFVLIIGGVGIFFATINHGKQFTQYPRAKQVVARRISETPQRSNALTSTPPVAVQFVPTESPAQISIAPTASVHEVKDSNDQTDSSTVKSTPPITSEPEPQDTPTIELPESTPVPTEQPTPQPTEQITPPVIPTVTPGSPSVAPLLQLPLGL